MKIPSLQEKKKKEILSLSCLRSDVADEKVCSLERKKKKERNLDSDSLNK